MQKYDTRTLIHLCLCSSYRTGTTNGWKSRFFR